MSDTPSNSLHTEVRPWGTYWVMDEGELPSGQLFQTKRLSIKPGHGASHHVHERQWGHWTILDGVATVLLDGKESTMTVGQSVDIPAHMTHRISNPGPADLVFTELLMGEYIGEDDITRLEDNYGREGTKPSSARTE